MDDEREYLPLSWLSQACYCLRRAGLLMNEQVWLENEDTAKGRNEHQKVHTQRIERRGTTVNLYEYEVFSARLGLHGKCDCIEATADEKGCQIQAADFPVRLYPVEYKHGTVRDEPEYKLQLCAQAMCLAERYHKLADGYTEEEIAAKLGDPAALAAQFAPTETASRPGSGRRVLTGIGLGFADLFAGLFFLFLGAWVVVFAAAGVACAACAVSLLANWNPYGLLPPMPYWCGAVAALSLLALGVLGGVGTVWLGGLLRQLLRSFGRFQRNALAASRGNAVLPGLPCFPQFTPKKKRALRNTALIALLLFIVCLTLTVLVSALRAGEFQFWHTWEWFAAAK